MNFFLKQVIRIVAKKDNSIIEGLATTYPLKPSFLRFIGKEKVKYFRVFNNTDNRNYAENTQNIVIKDFVSSMNIELEVTYRLSCPANKENELTEFLGIKETPEEVLIDFIEKYTHQFYNENSNSFIKELDKHLNKFIFTLDNEVKSKMGLDFVSKVYLKNADKVKDIFCNDKLKVTPRDMERWLPLKVEYRLKIKDKNIVALHINNKTYIKSIQEKINENIAEYISENITAHKLFFNFSKKDTALIALTQKINNFLIDYGYSIQLEKIFIKDMPLERFEEVEITNKRIPIDRTSENVFIKNRLQFELIDAGCYLEAGTHSLKDWAEEELTNLFALKVFDWEYIDFLVNFEDLKIDLETSMREKASKIGYKINQIITEPKLKENVFLHMDTYSFDYKELATNDSGISADFRITLTFMIKDKEAFKELLKYDDDAKESLRKILEVELKNVISYEYPERIFLQYYNEKFQGNTQSLKVTLESTLKEKLIKKLKAIVQDINIVPIDNGILKPLELVRGESRDFEISLFSKTGGDTIIYKATLVVLGHDNNNWFQLIDGKYTMESIVELVMRTLQSNISTYPENLLRFETPAHRNIIEKKVDKLARDTVSKRYGLIVEIENLDREKNTQERLEYKNKQKELEYISTERDENLTLLKNRAKQDREQLLDVSASLDEETQKEAELLAKRINIKEIDTSFQKRYDNNGSALKELVSNIENIDNLKIDNKSHIEDE